MGEMTDYEINKRLAEIAGVEVAEWTPREGGPVMLVWHEGGWQYDFWSPLTDWSQLGPLRERERIWITDSDDGTWFASTPPRCGTAEPTQRSPDLKRAICLAIIAAHQPDAGEGGA